MTSEDYRQLQWHKCHPLQWNELSTKFGFDLSINSWHLAQWNSAHYSWGWQMDHNWLTIGLQLDHDLITIGLPRLLATLPVVVRADRDARNSVPSSNAASSFLRDHILPVALLRFDALFLAAQRHHNHATFWRSIGTSFGGAELLRLAIMRRHAEVAAWRRCWWGWSWSRCRRRREHFRSKLLLLIYAIQRGGRRRRFALSTALPMSLLVFRS